MWVRWCLESDVDGHLGLEDIWGGTGLLLFVKEHEDPSVSGRASLGVRSVHPRSCAMAGGCAEPPGRKQGGKGATHRVSLE